MRFAVTVLLALVLLSVESVLVHRLGLALTRIDVTVALIAFLALRASTLEGAFSAFALGYMLDLMSGRPTGLYTFLAVLIFLVVRLGGSLVDVRSGLAFALLAAAADLLHSTLAVFLSWMTTAALGFSVSALAVQALLTGLAALLLYPLLRKIGPGGERAELGLLR
jgi:rod shape-determining protein MreD